MMKEAFLSLLIAVSAACVCGILELDNVDTLRPILRLSPTRLKGEDVEDQFGFAMALHQMMVVDPSDDRTTVASKTRILVGAPRGTFPGGLELDDLDLPAVDNTGLLYSCSILPNTTSPCEAVQGDEATLSGQLSDPNNDLLQPGGRLFDQRPNAKRIRRLAGRDPITIEAKKGQMLGAFVRSTGDTVIVCAPAWVVAARSYETTNEIPLDFAPTNSFPKGRCYYTDRNLRNVQYLDPCSSEGDEANVRSDIGQGYCNSGHSAAIFGTPPVFAVGSSGYGSRGTGTVFWGINQEQMLDRLDDNNFGRGNLCHPQIEEVSNDTMFCNPGTYPIIETSQGFRVTTGYITRNRTLSSIPPNVVASAPRYDNSVYRGRIDIYDVAEISVLLNVTALGQQIAEFFGYSLATVDLNNDQFDDLVVGAPMYSKIDADNLDVEIGRAYVFINTGGNLSSDPIILEGSEARSRFGTSVINLGDIDRDGFEDIAVGAPYEPGSSTDNSNSGAVYIYYGRNDLSNFGDSPLKITAKDMVDVLEPLDSLLTFGYSLAGQIDVDGNEYNDLAIGAYESRAVVVLRSLPVANVTMSLSTSSNNVTRGDKRCEISGTFYACFDLTVEVGYTGIGLDTGISVSVALEENRTEVGQRRQRIFFNESLSQSGITLILEPSSTSSAMKTVTVYLRNDISDLVSPLRVTGRVLQNEPTATDMPGNGHPEISDLRTDFRIRPTNPFTAQVDISNNCGPDNICQTDMSLSLDETVFLPEGQGYTSIEVGANNEVQFTLSLSNNGSEDAINIFLEVSHSESGVFSEQFRISFDNAGSPDIVCRSPCSVNQLFSRESSNVRITLSPTKSGLSPGSVETTFNLTSMQTQDTNGDNNAVQTTINIERRADLSLSMSLSPTSEVIYSNAMPEDLRERSDVGTRILVDVTVQNVRSTTIGTTMVNIYYPAKTGDFFFLLPDCDVTTSSNVVCDTTVLSGASELACTSSRRRKRHAISPVVKQRRRMAREAAASSVFPALTRQTRQEQTSNTKLNCRLNPENCLLLTCTISDLRGQSANPSRVSITGYVDERFFADQSEEFQLTTFATASFDTAAENTIDNGILPDNSSVILNLLPEGTESEGSASSGELIGAIVGVVVGSIIFVLVVAVALYCCGFFKRKGKAELKSDEDNQEINPKTEPDQEGTKTATLT